ncbi:hypothetical protein HRbin27_00642 [bacterium HR27]|nr:hypothetical protein HRbin27_00642 [bacterium HR27]
MRIRRGTGVGELREARLADDDRAGRSQTFDDRCIVLRDTTGQDGRAGSCRDTGHVDQVLEGDRKTVERSAVDAACQLGVSSLGFGQRLVGEDDLKGVQCRVAFGDPLECLLDELATRRLAAAQLTGEREDLRRVSGLRSLGGWYLRWRRQAIAQEVGNCLGREIALEQRLEGECCRKISLGACALEFLVRRDDAERGEILAYQDERIECGHRCPPLIGRRPLRARASYRSARRKTSCADRSSPL